MGRTLKQKHQPYIITFIAVNAVALGLLFVGRQRVSDLITSFTRGDWSFIGKLVAVPAVITLLTSAVGWAFSKRIKELLVFWKLRNCLPSSAAFTQVGKSDPRIDLEQISHKYGNLPTEPAAQTALWYRIYRLHESQPSVEDAHGAFLRFRELSAFSVVVLLIGFAGAAIFARHNREVWSFLPVFLLEYLVMMFAARNAARHFVTNVLALEGVSCATPRTEQSAGQDTSGAKASQ